MLTFHGSQELKDQRIAQVRAHRLADQLVKGQYWENGKGCAVACILHSSDHWLAESELGIPVELFYLTDRIFESLPNGEAMMWPERFLQAIPVGVDLRATHVNKRFVLGMLTDEKRGVMSRIPADDETTRKFTTDVVEFLKQGISEPAPTAAPDALRSMAYLAYFAYLADLADLADRADRAEILLEVLAASAPITSSPQVAAAAGER